MAGLPYKIVHNEIYGRYMVAGRKIKQGELILKEDPILVGSQLDGPLACFNCLKNLTNKGFVFCGECKIAVVCDSKCTGKFHSTEECNAIKQLDMSGYTIANNDQIVFPLRCLLLRKYKPDVFQQICQLENHLSARRNTAIYRRHRIRVEQILRDTKNLLDEEDIKDELVQKICGILDVNTFEIRPPHKIPITNPERECLRGLYLRAAIMAHNCRANTHISVDNHLVMTIYASVDIAEGAPIFFNYASVLQGTLDRRQHLREGKYFECNCDRCRDPSELSTDMSSLKCYKCRNGIVRPPESSKVDCDWECHSCKAKFNSSLIRTIVNEGRRLIETTDPSNCKLMEYLLKKLLSTFHANHFLVLEVMQNLVALYNGMQRSKLNLIRKCELCKHMLEVFVCLEPGISRLSAITMYELQSAMVDLYHKQFQSKEISVEELVQKLDSAHSILKKAVRSLLYEPSNSPEGQIARVAMSELKMLQLSLFNIKKDISGDEVNSKKVIKSSSKICRLVDQQQFKEKSSEEEKTKDNKIKSRRKKKIK